MVRYGKTVEETGMVWFDVICQGMLWFVQVCYGAVIYGMDNSFFVKGDKKYFFYFTGV
jgi:hypothetical protein